MLERKDELHYKSLEFGPFGPGSFDSIGPGTSIVGVLVFSWAW